MPCEALLRKRDKPPGFFKSLFYEPNPSALSKTIIGRVYFSLCFGSATSGLSRRLFHLHDSDSFRSVSCRNFVVAPGDFLVAFQTACALHVYHDLR
jgi:hypothetical protein